ncbi:MAG: hypothetical protein FWC67_00315 [Defluviitaleaceae bacterium]|nr:hypothetical protein [Defluviitaleaceae bacterium]
MQILVDGDCVFGNGFPFVDEEIVNRAMSNIPFETYSNIGTRVTNDMDVEYFMNLVRIRFPYRLYAVEIEDSVFSKLEFTERMILHCVYSRSCNGFVREKHITALLAENSPDWTIPYIVKVCDEYVIEILQAVYENLKDRNTNKFKNFCAENWAMFCKSYNRMISYWNEFYRSDYYRYEEYVGRKLFIECFGAKRNML